jgi:hypothetical protein
MFTAWPEEKRRDFEVSLPAYAAEVASVSGGARLSVNFGTEANGVVARRTRNCRSSHQGCQNDYRESVLRRQTHLNRLRQATARENDP